MRRAMYAIPVVLALQNSMNSVQRLYNKGMLTDDVYDNVKEMKAFCDHEWPDIQIEAEELHEGWGAHVWNEAMRFHQVSSFTAFFEDSQVLSNYPFRWYSSIIKRKVHNKRRPRECLPRKNRWGTLASCCGYWRFVFLLLGK